MTKRRPVKLLSLLKRIKRASMERGKKTDLAKWLKASRQQVNTWLSAKGKKPGGEVTLLMLEWVEAEEDKQKGNRADAQTPARHKTRKAQSRHEKTNRVRKKR